MFQHVMCTEKRHQNHGGYQYRFGSLHEHQTDVHVLSIIELLFVFVEAVFVAPRSEELGIATW